MFGQQCLEMYHPRLGMLQVNTQLVNHGVAT
jgi:hypothetical protein